MQILTARLQGEAQTAETAQSIGEVRQGHLSAVALIHACMASGAQRSSFPGSGRQRACLVDTVTSSELSGRASTVCSMSAAVQARVKRHHREASLVRSHICPYLGDCVRGIQLEHQMSSCIFQLSEGRCSPAASETVAIASACMSSRLDTDRRGAGTGTGEAHAQWTWRQRASSHALFIPICGR